MTLKNDLIKKYHKKEIISICMFDNLEHIVGNEVIRLIPPVKDYKFYSHSICMNYKNCPIAMEFYGVSK